jgi:hypothetical protein
MDVQNGHSLLLSPKIKTTESNRWSRKRQAHQIKTDDDNKPLRRSKTTHPTDRGERKGQEDNRKDKTNYNFRIRINCYYYLLDCRIDGVLSYHRLDPCDAEIPHASSALMRNA